MNHKSQKELLNEWKNIPKHWYNIYNWKSLSRKSYSDYIANIIVDNFDDIQLSMEGIRKENFRFKEHSGQSKLCTSIKQFTEPRFCRALFNLRYVQSLGKIIAYEVPLKIKQSAKHGKIDIISLNKKKLHIIEAKSYKSTESILKGLLEAYVYSNLLYIVKKTFIKECKKVEHNICTHLTLTPTLLTFEIAASGQQLLNFDKYPNIKQLLLLLNNNLREKGINELQCFMVKNPKDRIESSLETRPFDGKSKKILFKKNFRPEIQEIKIL